METTTALAGKPGLSIAVCWRPVPARAGEEHAITKLLRQRGNRVLQTRDSHSGPRSLGRRLGARKLRLVSHHPRRIQGCEKRRSASALSRVALGAAAAAQGPAGVPTPRLNTREIAKVLLHDARGDRCLQSNLRNLRRLSREGWPVLLVVSSQAWQESLVERGITAQWVPLTATEAGEEGGIQAAGGAEGERDIEALFLGSLEVPRRRKIVKELPMP